MVEPLPFKQIDAGSTPAPPTNLDALLTEAGWPEEWHGAAKAIVLCEDPSLDPARAGDSGVSVGLMQIGISRPGWDGWFKHFGVDEALAIDPISNLRVGLLIRQERGRFGGRGGWTCADLLGIY